MKTQHIHYKLCSLGLTLLAVGCASSEDEYDVTEWETLTDPALIYCVEQDGEITRLSAQERRVTYCLTSNGEEIELQEYYENRPIEQ